jgi:hypothetical protein
VSFLGQDDGYNALSTVRANAETKAADAQRRPRHHLESPRWPSGATMLRVLGLAVVVVVLVGWILAALNA